MEKLYIIGRDECPRELIVHGGETLNLSFIVLPGVSCKLDLDLDICGPGADVTLSGLYVCPADERVEFNIVLRHTAGGSVSRQLFKGLVLCDERPAAHSTAWLWWLRMPSTQRPVSPTTTCF